MFDLISGVTSSIGETFAGRDYSAPTASAPQMSMPGDAGPLGALGQSVGDFGRGLAQDRDHLR